MRIFRKKQVELIEPPMQNPGGDVNMAWMRWYNAKFGGQFLHAQAAYETLTYPELEPNLFDNEARWEQFYLSQYPEATDLEIAEAKFQMLNRRIHALKFKEPDLTLEVGMVNMNWLMWYSAARGCSILKAGVVAAQLMVRQGVFLQGATLVA